MLDRVAIAVITHAHLEEQENDPPLVGPAVAGGVEVLLGPCEVADRRKVAGVGDEAVRRALAVHGVHPLPRLVLRRLHASGRDERDENDEHGASANREMEGRHVVFFPENLSSICRSRSESHRV